MSKLSLGNSNTEVYPTHSLYRKYESQWMKVRDVIEGSEEVKLKRELYLKRLYNQKLKDYESYLDRANFVNTSARILNTNTGIIVRKEAEIKYPEEMAIYFEQDTESFISFKELFRFLIREVIQVSRAGVAIDINRKLNIPVPVTYNTENIVNWVTDKEGNLTSVLIRLDKVETNPVTFEEDTVTYYYNLYVDQSGKYRIAEVNDTQVVQTDVQPSIRGRSYKGLPVTVVTPFGLSIDPVKPVLIDVVNINLSHFKTSADLETGRHFVGLPQPVITGGNKDTDIYVGSDKALVIPNDKAKAYYMEFLGQGLDGLAKALKEKEGQMAQFSAQLADTSSKGSEAEGTVRLRYSSDAANLADIAGSVEIALNTIYGNIADWIGCERPAINLNKDFISSKLTYNELREVTSSWLEGSLSDEELRFNLERGEISLPKFRGVKKVKKEVETKKSEESKPTNEE